MALSAPPEPEPQAPPPPKEAAEKEAPGPSKEPAAKEPKEAKEPEKGDEKPKARPKKEEKREQDRARKTAEPEAKLSAAPPPQAPPPAGPPGPPLSENGRERYDAFFGLPKDESRYVRFLPPLYSGLPFLGSFLLAFEAVLTPIEQIVDHFDLYLDPGTSPERFLDQLARWLGLTLDEKWPPEKRRAVLKESAELYRRRGTRWGLSRHIEIYAGVPPKITEPKNRPHHFKVSIKLPKSARVEEETLRRIVAANKPAHATYELEVKRGS
jgi:phage tail-like protein